MKQSTFRWNNIWLTQYVVLLLVCTKLLPVCMGSLWCKFWSWLILTDTGRGWSTWVSNYVLIRSFVGLSLGYFIPTVFFEYTFCNSSYIGIPFIIVPSNPYMCVSFKRCRKFGTRSEAHVPCKLTWYVPYFSSHLISDVCFFILRGVPIEILMAISYKMFVSQITNLLITWSRLKS